MSIWSRWVRFNVVGAGGMALQLLVLSGLHRLVPTLVVLETAVAVECAVLHNFAWHLHLTWRDRAARGTWPARLVKFQLSNGMVSLVGNVVLMHALVDLARWPILLANGLAIAVCSLLNFGLGDRFVFATEAGSMR